MEGNEQDKQAERPEALRPEELKERLSYWQRVLRLQDWLIHVEMVDSDEIDNNSGECQVHQHTKTVVIKLIKPEAFNRTSAFSKNFPNNLDVEITLVHELLHVPFDGLFVEDDDDEIREEREEQAIELLAQALVRLDRGQV